MGEPISTKSFVDIPFARDLIQTKNIDIDSTAIDVGNTGQTHILRAGLLLAFTAATGLYTEYRTGGAAGEGDIADCILLHDVDLKDGDAGAANTDHVGVVMWQGTAVLDHVVLYDAAAAVDLKKQGGGDGFIEFVTA